ncbi:uncharacterized protein SAPINGB_P006273 [Magnusiomyces paraingens]|uniref:Phosphoribosylaminoimidazole carboxylase n=1 Tax=Magnusiomyces paraingens TaxID=2606893 RepID=A0A5E8CB76_9ASCO|nr:uncharacterized protein SAPINGB_P006273 [Saprochaete ingens]VVT58566.1 unnamed protein product [Saprochaete ingens]
MDSKVLGILGGGQLGRMMVEAANRLNVKTVILDGENSPAKQINAQNSHVNGSFTNSEAIFELAEQCDVLTVEIEHVNADVLAQIEAKGKVQVHPSPATIKLIQDKYTQKLHLIKHGVATADVEVVEESTEQALAEIGTKFGYPYMLKSRTNAYDGRGNYVVKSAADHTAALAALQGLPLYAERFADFTHELAVMVVRAIDGTTYAYPTVETVQRNNICETVYAPARVADSIRAKAQFLADKCISSLPQGAGIYGVEMFLLRDGSILLNEIAPRPHNSGHYTIDGCVTSQFEAHVRAVLGLPFARDFATMATPNTVAIMYNILGADTPNGELEDCKRSLTVPGTIIHLYGKTTRPNRKMGHINIIAGSMSQAEARLARVLGKTVVPEPSSSSSSEEKEDAVAGTSSQPLVGVIMGSDSDLPVMSAGCNILKKFGVPFEVKIVSAHRTPHRMTRYATEAAARGLRVVIAGAGGAAHLPGMVAAMTSLPVVGVPVKGSTLDGVDSLHSIVQMPRGIPVATVAINNSTNAALLAIRILGAFMPEYQTKIDEYHVAMETEVLGKTARLEAVGYEKY